MIVIASSIRKCQKYLVKFKNSNATSKIIWPHCITFWYHIDKKVQFLKMTSFKSSFPVFYLHFTAKKKYLRYWFLSLWENCLQSCFNLLLLCTLRGARVSTFWGKCENFRKCYLTIHPKMDNYFFAHFLTEFWWFSAPLLNQI